MPAKAAIQGLECGCIPGGAAMTHLRGRRRWIPACAGMTVGRLV
jgi:hypothetical protein